MKKWIKLLIFLLIVVLLIIGAVRLVKKRKAQEAAIPIAKEYAVLVHTLQPKTKHVTLTADAIAVVQNDANIKIASKYSGRIIALAKVGAKVKKGDIVARLDDTPLQSKLTSLKAQKEAVTQSIASTKVVLSNLKKIHARTKKLLAVKGASIEQYEKEQNQISATKAQLASLRAKLASLKESIKEIQNERTYTTLRSSVDGVVAKRFVNEGDMAMPGKPIIAINSQKENYLVVRVPKDIKIYGVVYKGKTYPVTPLQSTFNSLAEYKANVNDSSLIAGERVNVAVVTFQGKGVLLPHDAILNRNGKSYILVVKGNSAEAKEVHIIENANQGVVVKESFNGKKIIVAKPDIMLKLLSGIKLKEIKG
ncbi:MULTISPECIES: efflux RND transporter periplasmic adaptor subunit [unclassified Nitratiruptor]|uniref:efflux RND transporter periplasmic adaptor subunit n=1 Tax=unclassified Nitratiruptor TaxID=2624044 RepID=UPI001916858A|nr:MULTISPECIES: biotin/lipoyl-binding protein [unclassified Nitratiruptor]BCD59346.1 efflux transporter, RND family, MFP subunit [Nitratiruptor sp. YY08-10]BCD63270.1 efflux transporter, RND family, MFP subunit [Nitratiruptor sp. YY08-14]